MTSLAFLTAAGGAVRRHDLHQTDAGALLPDSAHALAAELCALFGVDAQPIRVASTPAPDAHDPGFVLAGAVLTFAAAMQRDFPAVVLLGVGWDGECLLPLDLPETGLSGLAKGENALLLLNDDRHEVGMPSLAERVRTHLEAEGSSVAVAGVTNLEQVLTAVFGGAGWRQESRASKEAFSAAADNFLQIVLRRRKERLPWYAMASIAQAHLLQEKSANLLASDADCWKAGFARDVARRHAGDGVIPCWPAEEAWESMPPDDRLAIAAHIVQGAADSDVEAIPIAVQSALEAVDADGTAAPLRATEVLGAIGRAQASAGDFGGAIATLQRACHAWLNWGKPDEMSFAVCELLRVSALATSQARALAQRCAEAAETSEDSKSYVHLAKIQAAVQLGEWQHVLTLLDASAAAKTAHPAALRPALLRMRHRALVQLGRRAEAAEVMAELERDGETDQLALARLDKALQEGSDWLTIVDAMFQAGADGQEAVRTWQRIVKNRPRSAWTVEDARRLAEEYRY